LRRRYGCVFTRVERRRKRRGIGHFARTVKREWTTRRAVSSASWGTTTPVPSHPCGANLIGIGQGYLETSRPALPSTSSTRPTCPNGRGRFLGRRPAGQTTAWNDARRRCSKSLDHASEFLLRSNIAPEIRPRSQTVRHRNTQPSGGGKTLGSTSTRFSSQIGERPAWCRSTGAPGAPGSTGTFALKVIKGWAMDTRSLSRFEAERQPWPEDTPTSPSLRRRRPRRRPALSRHGNSLAVTPSPLTATSTLGISVRDGPFHQVCIRRFSTAPSERHHHRDLKHQRPGHRSTTTSRHPGSLTSGCQGPRANNCRARTLSPDLYATACTPAYMSPEQAETQRV